jgi:hypothetical protein
VAVLAAGKQAKAWQFLETFYDEQGEENSGYVTDSYLQGIASQIAGLNPSKRPGLSLNVSEILAYHDGERRCLPHAKAELLVKSDRRSVGVKDM